MPSRSRARSPGSPGTTPLPATVRLYDRLFSEPQPEAGGRDFRSALNPHSLQVVQAQVEPSLAALAPEQHVQFERHGYFVTDRLDHSAAAPLFNRVAALKDGWAR